MKNLYLLLLLFFSTSILTAELRNGETDEKVIKKELVKMLSGPSSIGTDYWLSVPPPYLVADPQSFTRFFIASGTDATVRIRQGDGSGIDITKQVPAGSTESFDLKPGECQPYIWEVGQPAAPAQVYTGKALNITSTAPIIVYVVVRYQATSDGYLALPTHGLGSEYISSVYDSRPYNSVSLPNMLTIVSPYDRTKVNFTLGGNLNTIVHVQGGGELRPGESRSWNMNKGDVLVLSNKGDFQTLSGSYISSNKPIGVISGQACTDVPVNTPWCDYTVEMDIPIHSWGRVLHMPWVRNRKRASVMRVFAKEDETTVYKDGQELFYFTNGCEFTGSKLNEGWIETRIWPVGIEPGPAVLTSDKPIYASIYNPGQSDDGVVSDPFSIVITPVEQFQNEIIFATPASGGGRNFSTNFINIVFELDEFDQIPEDMEFGKVEAGGEVDWKKVRTTFGANSDKYYIPGTTGDAGILEDSEHKGRKFAEKNILLPGDGVYVIRSSALFTGYSYGFDSYDSYGFPTSTALRVVSKDTLPPTINWTMDCFGNIEGTTTDNPDPDTDGVRVGLHIPSLDWDNSFNYIDFRYDNNNFIPGTPTTAWSLKVEDPDKPARAIVVFSDRSGNVSRDTIEYYPELLDLREVVADDTNGDLYDEPYGVVTLNLEYTRRYEIENLSDVREFTLKDIKLKIQDQKFEIVEPLDWDIDEPFEPGEIRQLTVRFFTEEMGGFLDSIGLETECNDKFFARMSANTGLPGITAADYAYPAPLVLNPDQSQTKSMESQNIWVENSCIGSETTDDLEIIGYIDFATTVFTHNLDVVLAGVDANNPLVLEPGERISFKVTFLADATGDYEDQIEFLYKDDGNNIKCDPISIIKAKAVKPGILASGYTFPPRRINYDNGLVPEFNEVTGPNVNSDLITAYNNSDVTEDGYGHTMEIRGIEFNGISGPTGTNDGLSAFSFNQNFTTALPNVEGNFSNDNIAPGNSTPQRKLYFSPTVVGPYEIEYSFKSNAEVQGDEVRYTITGHGLIPNMQAFHEDATGNLLTDIDFGTILAGVPSEAISKSIRISNLPLDPANGMVLEIYDINWTNISTDPADFGTENFIADETAFLEAYGTEVSPGEYDYPVLLNIGETAEIEITYYTDDAVNEHTGRLEIISDADVFNQNGPYNNEITLRGNADRPGISYNAVDLYSCIANPLVIDENYVHTDGTEYNNCFYYQNDGEIDVTLTNIAFDDVNGYLTIDGGQIIKADGSKQPWNGADPVLLSTNDRLVLFITYLPTARIAGQTITMSVETDIVNEDDRPGTEEFEISSDSFFRNTTNLISDANGVILNDNGTPIQDINYNVESHRNITYQVSLNDITPQTNLEEARLQEIKVEVTFRRGFLQYNPEMGVKLLGAYSDPTEFDIVGAVIYDSYKFEPEASRNNKLKVMQTVSFTIEAFGNNIFNDPGEIFELSFTTGLTNFPTEGIDGVSIEDLYVEGRDDINELGKSVPPLESTIKTVLESGNSCGFIAPPGSDVTLSLDPVCGMALRPLALSEFSNVSGNVAPNPVPSSGANIDFSIAFDSPTLVRIVDMNGDVVAVLKDEEMKAGEYTLPIPVEKLSNGAYFFEINSTKLNFKEKFVVSK